MHRINTIIKLFLSKSAGKLFSQALCFFAFAFQYEGFGQVKKPLALRLCLWLLTPKLFSHTPDNLCVATSASPVVNVRFLKYLSHSALFLSVQSTYKSDLFSWFHKKNPNPQMNNNKKKQQRDTTMGSDFFFSFWNSWVFCHSSTYFLSVFQPSSLWANMFGRSYPSITCTGLWCILCSAWCSTASVLPAFGFWALR